MSCLLLLWNSLSLRLNCRFCCCCVFVRLFVAITFPFLSYAAISWYCAVVVVVEPYCSHELEFLPSLTLLSSTEILCCVVVVVFSVVLSSCSVFCCVVVVFGVVFSVRCLPLLSSTEILCCVVVVFCAGSGLAGLESTKSVYSNSWSQTPVAPGRHHQHHRLCFSHQTLPEHSRVPTIVKQSSCCQSGQSTVLQLLMLQSIARNTPFF